MGKIPSTHDRLLAEALMLPKQDRLKLAKAIWRSIQRELKASGFTAEQKAELDHRLAEAARNPSAGSTWEEVEARILRTR